MLKVILTIDSLLGHSLEYMASCSELLWLCLGCPEDTCVPYWNIILMVPR